jgi:hypothetical protein
LSGQAIKPRSVSDFGQRPDVDQLHTTQKDLDRPVTVLVKPIGKVEIARSNFQVGIALSDVAPVLVPHFVSAKLPFNVTPTKSSPPQIQSLARAISAISDPESSLAEVKSSLDTTVADVIRARGRSKQN